jgi:phage recombination protein Bet
MDTTTELQLAPQAATRISFSDEQIRIITDMYAKDATPAELEIFMHIARSRGLDPIQRQLVFIKRWSNKEKRNICTPQTTIDGLRLLSERTGNYAPGRKTEFEYDAEGRLFSATAFVMKHVRGTWFEVPGTTLWSEFGPPNIDAPEAFMWKKMSHHMLSKTSEAVAIRKAFPAESGNLYTDDEIFHGEKASTKEMYVDTGDPEADRMIIGINTLIKALPPPMLFDIGKHIRDVINAERARLAAVSSETESEPQQLEQQPEPPAPPAPPAQSPIAQGTLEEYQQRYKELRDGMRMASISLPAVQAQYLRTAPQLLAAITVHREAIKTAARAAGIAEDKIAAAQGDSDLLDLFMF